ncbi:MAG TPA: sugar ABC transporter permease [Thermomicrobiales bacterium]|nr:sugar ABC transporter permease [Thermomicrobiales bacterium]
MQHQKYRLIVPFLAPAIILYAVFVLWPYGQSFYTSLTEWSGLSPNKTFIGLANFDKLIHDPQFWNALRHNGIMLVVLPVVTIALALLFAALFTQGGQAVPGAGFYRVVFFFPQVMAIAIIGILWSFVFNPNAGLLNGFLRVVGLGGVQRAWLGDPKTSLGAVAAVVIWQAVGFYMVLFIAGMEAIPTSFYEAAIIDGATRWTMFWRITLPLLWDNLQVALVYIGIGALDLFTIVQVMTEGGPNQSSEVVAHYLYTTAFQYGQFGYATAIGVALLFLTLVLSLLTFTVTRRERIEY